MDLKQGLANGSRGIITDFISDFPLVKFLNGEERVIDYHIWDVEENGKPILKIPLKKISFNISHSANNLAI